MDERPDSCRRMSYLFDFPRVDDKHHVVDGDARLSDVGGKNLREQMVQVTGRADHRYSPHMNEGIDECWSIHSQSSSRQEVMSSSPSSGPTSAYRSAA